MANKYEKHKERLQKEAPEKYQNLTKEEKDERCNKNLSEENKQKQVQYRRIYYLTHKK